jgi:hypothetical protein
MHKLVATFNLIVALGLLAACGLTAYATDLGVFTVGEYKAVLGASLALGLLQLFFNLITLGGRHD